MACHLFATEPSHELMMTSCYIVNCEHNSVISIKIYQFSQKEMNLKMLAAKWLYLTLPLPEGGKDM